MKLFSIQGSDKLPGFMKVEPACFVLNKGMSSPRFYRVFLMALSDSRSVSL